VDDPQATVIYKAVGKAVAKRRNALQPKVTQAQLAERTQGRLSRSAIANIESGRQRVAVHHLYDLAAAMNCKPSEFLPLPREIFGTRASLAERMEGDPGASDFTRRVLDLEDLDEITTIPEGDESRG